MSGASENEFGLSPFLVVLSVQPNSPGMRAGFFPFDEVLAVGELTSLGLNAAEAFQAAVEEIKKNQGRELTV